MDMTDQKIKQILKQETEIPERIERQVLCTLDQIAAGTQRRSERENKPFRSKMQYVKAAAAALVLLAGVGTSAYAAGKYFGLLDFLSGWGMTAIGTGDAGAARLEETEREQSGGTETGAVVSKGVEQISFSNDHVNYTVREAVCDENLLYMVVEAVPKDKEKYLLIPEDCMEEDSVAYLGMDSVTEGTVGAYAETLGKELLRSSVGLFREGELVSCTLDSKQTEDGTVYYCITGTNQYGSGNIDLTCVGTAVEAGMQVADRAEAECTVVNNSFSIRKTYRVKSDAMENETGIVLEEIDITETELGLYAKFYYHGSDETAEKMMENCGLELADAHGEKLVSMPYYAGSGIEFFDEKDGMGLSEMRAYQKTDLTQGSFVTVYDYEADVTYGPYEIGEEQ